MLVGLDMHSQRYVASGSFLQKLNYEIIIV